jgi:hypothetical protein
MRTGVRHIQKLNQRDPEAEPTVEAEVFDLDTGQRIPKGWRRVASKPPQRYPNFTIPTDGRPGRYFVPSLEGREQSTVDTVRELQEAGVLEVVAA